MVAPRHLNSLQAIELALRTGSVKEAAHVLGITPAAAGQRIKALEDVLGVDLLMRGRSGLQPSPALAAAADRLAAAFHEIEHVAELLELQRAQQICLRVDPDFADHWLRPRLPAFCARYPNLAIVVVGEGATRAPDCTISLAPPEQRPECDILLHDLVDAIGTWDIQTRLARQPADEELRGFPLIHHDYYATDPAIGGWDGLSGQVGLAAAYAGFGVRFGRLADALDAALAGAGVMRCGLAFAQSALASGRLVRLFEGRLARRTTLAFQARYARHALVRPQIRHFREWLQAEAAQTRAWLP